MLAVPAMNNTLRAHVRVVIMVICGPVPAFIRRCGERLCCADNGLPHTTPSSDLVSSSLQAPSHGLTNYIIDHGMLENIVGNSLFLLSEKLLLAEG
jgi:hypothetical protein